MMNIEIGSNSTGGTGYLTRILKAAFENPGQVINVIVSKGDFQEQVYTSILCQMLYLTSVTTIRFEYRIRKA